MSKVEINNEGGRWRVIVDDGPDLAPAIKYGGLAVEFPGEPHGDMALVHVTFMAAELSMHVDGAVVDARQELLAQTARGVE